MVQERQCDFCGREIEPGTGTMFVHVNGQVVHYCSSKCEGNADLGRVPREVEWTAERRGIRERARAREATIGSQEELEESPAEPPTEEEGPAAGVDSVPGESDAEAVASTTRTSGSDSEEAVAADDARVEADVDRETEDESAQSVEDEEIEEVAGRRAGGDDPDVGENVSETNEEAASEETDPDAAEASAEGEVRETDDETEGREAETAPGADESNE